MPLTADSVSDEARDLKRGVEGRKPMSQRRDAAGHASCVADEQHRSLQPLGNLGRRAFVARRRSSVEEPHHSFDQRDVCPPRRMGERREDRFTPHHPSIEVMRGRAGRAHVVGRIEIIRAAFEDGRSQPPRPQGPDETNHDSRLADIAGGACNDETRNHHESISG